jgi:hypothetical protein
MGRRRIIRRLAWGAGLVATASLVAILVAAGTANGFLARFEPTVVTGAQPAAMQLAGLPDVSPYGHVTWTSPPSFHNADTAAPPAGLPSMVPGSLPRSIVAHPTFHVLDQTTGTLTVDADAVRGEAQRRGQAPPEISSAIAGSTVTVELGPGLAAVYGEPLPVLDGEGDVPKSLPPLVIAEIRSPSVHTSGAGLAEIERFLLTQPGVSDKLAAQIRAIGDPTSELPIPLPVSPTDAHTVRVAGVDGFVIGDSTGIGSIVVWQRDGIVHAVAGALTEDEVLSVADSLH